jgi:hypothetical protein
MSFRRLFVSAAISLLATLFASEASALEPPFTESRLTVGGGPRIGGNGLNFGLGGEIGFTLEAQVYIGALGDYWFGDHEEQSVFGITQEAESSGWDVLGVVGYDFGISETFVLRPFGGAGLFHGDVRACTGFPDEPRTCIEASDTEAAGVFGGRGLFLIGTNFHLGPEIRVIFAEESAGILAGNIGGVF